jgi:endonuclease-3
MQLGLDIGAGAGFADIRDELRQAFGPYELATPREPIAQLVKSMISSRTYDAVSAAAYDRLIRRFPTWPDLMATSAIEVEPVIFDVTWPEKKAAQLIAALKLIHAERADYDLRFLRRGSVSQGLAWLEDLPGVGRKISASTLNFSTLSLPALVIDTHVLRVFRRLGLVSPRADIEKAYDNVMRSLGSWSAGELRGLHVLVKFLGQTVCRASRPDCSRCPIFRHCGGVQAYRSP